MTANTIMIMLYTMVCFCVVHL